MHGYELSTLGYGHQILLIATTTFALQLSQVVHIFQFALQHFPTPSKHFFSLLVLKIQGLLKLASLLNKENVIFPSFNRLNLHLCHASLNATLKFSFGMMPLGKSSSWSSSFPFGSSNTSKNNVVLKSNDEPSLD